MHFPECEYLTLKDSICLSSQFYRIIVLLKYESRDSPIALFSCTPAGESVTRFAKALSRLGFFHVPHHSCTGSTQSDNILTQYGGDGSFSLTFLPTWQRWCCVQSHDELCLNLKLDNSITWLTFRSSSRNIRMFHSPSQNSSPSCANLAAGFQATGLPKIWTPDCARHDVVGRTCGGLTLLR